MLSAYSMGGSEKSLFRRKYNLDARIEKRLRVSKDHKINDYYPLVVEYPSTLSHYCNFELMCVDGRLNLRALQEFVLRKMRKSASHWSLLFEIRGKLREGGQKIGALSAKLSQEDGFLYIFIRSESTF